MSAHDALTDFAEMLHAELYAMLRSEWNRLADFAEPRRYADACDEMLVAIRNAKAEFLEKVQRQTPRGGKATEAA